MSCRFEKELKEDHENMKNPVLGGMMMQCPIYDGQICYWCCLHVRDVANPLKRNYYTRIHPQYVEVAEKLSERNLDGVWETCSRCHNQST